MNGMRWQYDSQVDILNVWLDKGKIAGSTKLSDPEAVIDLSADGRVVALEIFDSSEQVPHIHHRPQGEVIAGRDLCGF
jgi:uncharacterized protein YuzE